MISNYFPVWVVAVMGGSDGHISLVNTVTMALMLGIGPWLGAVSDRMPRRLPILIATTTGCCLITLLVGNDLRSSLILFLGANLLFQAGLIMYDSLLPAVEHTARTAAASGAPPSGWVIWGRSSASASASSFSPVAATTRRSSVSRRSASSFSPSPAFCG